MKRPNILATLEVTEGDSLEPIYGSEKIAYAFNSGIRASEALAREYARSLGIILEGDTPVRVGDIYTRVWRSGATQAVAVVRRLADD